MLFLLPFVRAPGFKIALIPLAMGYYAASFHPNPSSITQSNVKTFGCANEVGHNLLTLNLWQQGGAGMQRLFSLFALLRGGSRASFSFVYSVGLQSRQRAFYVIVRCQRVRSL